MKINIARTPLKSLGRTFSSFRHRNYRLYWCGQVISLIGSSMQNIGQAWLVLMLTHSAWQLGLVGALQAAPILLFSLFGGVLADRWPKRAVFLITQCQAMLQALLLWLLLITNTLQLWHLYVLALLLGLSNSLSRPTGRAFLIELVGRDDLPNAVALGSSLSTLASIIGPGLGGIIIASRSVTMLFLLNALSFLPIIAALLLIRRKALYAQTPRLEDGSIRRNTWQSLHEGLAYCFKTPTILLLLLVVGLTLLFGSNFNIILPLFATSVLHVGATGFGFLSAAAGAGALLAALWLAWRNQRPTLRSILIIIVIYGILEVVFALSRFYALAIVLIAGVGFLEIAFAAQGTAMLQIVAPEHLSGRVMSAQVLFFDGSLPLGFLLMGWLSAIYGPSLALLIGALLCLLVALGGWLWHRTVLQKASIAAERT